MGPLRTVPEQTLRQLEQYDTCAVSNAIEQFRVRTRNEGFVNGSIRCLFPEFGPRVGYAVTACIRTSSTPITGSCYYDHPDWWSYVNSMPKPRFLVVQDVDHMPGIGALFGEVHASIALALGCVAYMTNGAVRDLPGVAGKRIQLFASSIAVSHSYAHVVEFGIPVEIGGMAIKPGTLLHGDQHGVLEVPLSIASDVPAKAQQLIDSEQQLIDFCQSPHFSVERLKEHIRRASKTVTPA